MNKEKEYKEIYAVEDPRYGYLYFAETLKTIKKMYKERGTDSGYTGNIMKLRLYK